jgi:putative transposase
VYGARNIKKGQEIMEERGVNVDHATLNRWVIRYAPTIAAKAHSQKQNIF